MYSRIAKIYSIFAAVSLEKRLIITSQGWWVSLPPTPFLAKEVGRFVREKGRFVGRYEGFKHTIICMICIDREIIEGM